MNFPPAHVILAALALAAGMVLLPPLAVALALLRQATGQPHRAWLAALGILGFGLGSYLLVGLHPAPPGPTSLHHPAVLGAISCVALLAVIPVRAERSLPTNAGGWFGLLWQALGLGVATGTYGLGWTGFLRGVAVDRSVAPTIAPPYIAIPLSCAALFALLLVRSGQTPRHGAHPASSSSRKNASGSVRTKRSAAGGHFVFLP